MSAPLAPEPRTYAASDLGPPPIPAQSTSVTVHGPNAHGRVINGPNLQVRPGLFRVTFSYEMSDPSPRAAPAIVTLAPSRGEVSTLSSTFLTSSSSQRETSLDLVVPIAGRLNATVYWRGSGQLTIYWLAIARTTTCENVHCLN